MAATEYFVEGIYQDQNFDEGYIFHFIVANDEIFGLEPQIQGSNSDQALSACARATSATTTVISYYYHHTVQREMLHA